MIGEFLSAKNLLPVRYAWIVSLLVLPSVFSEPLSASKMADEQSYIEVIHGNTEFAATLYKQLSSKAKGGNIFFSPLSLSTVLSMTLAGACENTATEIMSSLGISSLSKDSVNHAYEKIIAVLQSSGTTKIANNIFVQEQFDVVPSFTETLKSNYSSKCTNVDFTKPGASDIINNWVKAETNEKITKLVKDLSPETAMIIANAIYFKSFWAKQFSSSNTNVEPFHVSQDEIVNIKLMYQSAKFRIAFHEKTDCAVLELPHENDLTTMLIFLPREISGLQKLETNFNKLVLDEVMSNMTEMKAQVWLPAFKLEESYELKSTLEELGIKDLFSISKANLSGISKVNNLYASEVIHKSFIEVNEEGTEAAAASGIILMKRCIQIQEPFRADHPFMFCILQKQTNNVLFLGRLSKPEPVPVQHEEL